MDRETINRRQVLAGAGAAALAMGATTVVRPVIAEAASTDSTDVVGAWNVTIVDHDRGETIHAVVAFSPGGGVTEIDDGGATGVGGWSDTGERGFRFKFLQFIVDPQDGKLYFTIRGQGRIGTDRRSISGTSTVTVADGQGNVLFESTAPQTFSGERLK